MLRFFCLILFGLATLLPAVERIDDQTLKALEQSLHMDAHARFTQTIVSNEDLSRLVSDPRKLHALDGFFSHRIPGEAITNQQSTGRCWMFAGLNILRAQAAARLNCKDIQFSQNYLFFYDKLEKSNLFLAAVERTREKPLEDRTVEFLMKNTADDGGQWVGLAELVRKYGAVPLQAMPETFASSHSGPVNRVVSRLLRKAALQIRSERNARKRGEIRLDTLKKVYRILAINFGIPPKTFSFRYEDREGKVVRSPEYTPRSFAAEVITQNLDDFYAIYSIPTRPFNALYEIDLDKAVEEGPNMRFANLELGQLKEMCRKSILDNQPVWFGCDVGQDSLGKEGLMVPEIRNFESAYDLDLSMSRLETFQTYGNSPTHAMVFTGLDEEKGKTTKWLVENSWGAEFGKSGYYHMADAWFDSFVQVVVIHMKYIPEKVLKLYQGKATVLPPWDPMYAAVKSQP